MFRFSSTASVTLVEVGWLAPCNAKPVRARRFSFETGSEPSRFFRSETPRTIAQPTETWLLDRYAQPRLFFNDFHVHWTNLRGPATAAARIPKVKGSRLTGVDTLKRNDPIQHERGLTVLMRRTASGVPDHSRIHLRVCGTRVDFA
jgi:hypothetical protein